MWHTHLSPMTWIYINKSLTVKQIYIQYICHLHKHTVTKVINIHWQVIYINIHWQVSFINVHGEVSYRNIHWQVSYMNIQSMEYTWQKRFWIPNVGRWSWSLVPLDSNRRAGKWWKAHVHICGKWPQCPKLYKRTANARIKLRNDWIIKTATEL